MNILIVDDELETGNYIAQVITEHFNYCICQIAKTYDSAIDYISNQKFDIIILDYELDKSNSLKNGLNLGKFISQSSEHKHIPIVFATSYPEHIYNAVNSLNCVYYMLKPFYKSNIIDMMNKILTISREIPKLTFHNSVGIHVLIKVSEIVYIESERHNIIVHTNDEKYHFTNYSLSDIERDSLGQLIRCHKSYLINYDYLINVDRSNNIIQLLLSDDTSKIPVGRKYSEAVYDFCSKNKSGGQNNE